MFKCIGLQSCRVASSAGISRWVIEKSSIVRVSETSNLVGRDGLETRWKLTVCRRRWLQPFTSEKLFSGLFGIICGRREHLIVISHDNCRCPGHDLYEYRRSSRFDGFDWFEASLPKNSQFLVEGNTMRSRKGVLIVKHSIVEVGIRKLLPLEVLSTVALSVKRWMSVMGFCLSFPLLIVVAVESTSSHWRNFTLYRWPNNHSWRMIVRNVRGWKRIITRRKRRRKFCFRTSARSCLFPTVAICTLLRPSALAIWNSIHLSAYVVQV